MLKIKRLNILLAVAIIGMSSFAPISVSATSTYPENISVKSDGTPSDINGCGYGSGLEISSNKRYALFCGSVGELVGSQYSNTLGGAFVRDRSDGITKLATVSSAGEPANNNFDRPTMTNDGSKVAFLSSADNLDNRVNQSSSIKYYAYIHDFNSGDTTLESLDSSGNPLATTGNNGLAMSDDGNIIAYIGQDSSQASIYIRNLSQNTVQTIPYNYDNAIEVSGDGQYVFYQKTDSSNVMQLWRYSILSNTSQVVSTTPQGDAGNAISSLQRNNVASYDGRYVIFVTRSSNLLPSFGSTCFDKGCVVRKDIQTGAVDIVNATTDNTLLPSISLPISLSADGNIVGFVASAAPYAGPHVNTDTQEAYIRNVSQNTLTLASVNADGQVSGQVSGIGLSPDGQEVLFSALNMPTGSGYTFNGVYINSTLGILAKPDIQATLSPTPNTLGWNNSNTTLTWTVNGYGYAITNGTGCTTQTVTTDTAGTTYTCSATSSAGTTSKSVVVKLDKTKPTASNPTINGWLVINWGNPVITADASDALSGVTGGEYYTDNDPGQGNGTPMTYSNGKIRAQPIITTGTANGWHTIYMRSKDAAGNWSTPTSVRYYFF